MRKPVKSSARKRPPKSKSRPGQGAIRPRPATESDPAKRTGADSKQARVIAMLQSPSGATIEAMVQQTGWQPHSVRGFLAGVVRKKLKLRLHSSKVDGQRVYRIEGTAQAPAASARHSKRDPA
jgi:hypothetical protein